MIAEKRRYILDDIFRRQLVDNKETPDLGGEIGGDKDAKEKRDRDNFKSLHVISIFSNLKGLLKCIGIEQWDFAVKTQKGSVKTLNQLVSFQALKVGIFVWWFFPWLQLTPC